MKDKYKRIAVSIVVFLFFAGITLYFVTTPRNEDRTLPLASQTKAVHANGDSDDSEDINKTSKGIDHFLNTKEGFESVYSQMAGFIGLEAEEASQTQVKNASGLLKIMEKFTEIKLMQHVFPFQTQHFWANYIQLVAMAGSKDDKEEQPEDKGEFMASQFLKQFRSRASREKLTEADQLFSKIFTILILKWVRSPNELLFEAESVKKAKELVVQIPQLIFGEENLDEKNGEKKVEENSEIVEQMKEMVAYLSKTGLLDEKLDFKIQNDIFEKIKSFKIIIDQPINALKINEKVSLYGRINDFIEKMTDPNSPVF